MQFKPEQLEIEIKECKTFKERLFGFMFQFKPINYGLLFKNCRSIHTFFMFQKIDVIMTDFNNNIIYTKANLKPWRFLYPRPKAVNIYELPLGSIEKLNQKR